MKPGSVAGKAYNVDQIEERHRHRWEFNNDFREQYQEKGMSFSGLSPDELLVEISEIVDHPFMVGSQFHPEFLSRPNRAHPLFEGLIKAGIDRRDSKGAKKAKSRKNTEKQPDKTAAQGTD